MKIFRLVHEEAKRNAIDFISKIDPNSKPVYVVKVSEEKRSLDQNAAQWPILQAISEQVQWPVNGQMVHMSPDDWKNVLTAGFKRESNRVAMGVDGGMVMLGYKTSQMNKSEFSEWLEYLHWFCTMREVDLHYGS